MTRHTVTVSPRSATVECEVDDMGVLRVVPDQVGRLGGGGFRAFAPFYIDYLLRDVFTTDAAAPLTSPRTCEPGPGTLTLTQTDGQLSTASGKLVFPAQTTPVLGDLMALDSTARTRALGLSIMAKIAASTLSSNGLLFGWTDNAGGGFANAAEMFWIRTNDIGVIPNKNSGGNPDVVGTPVATIEYNAEIVLRTTGAFYLLRGGIYAGRLMWVSHVNTTATLKAGLSNHSAVGTLDDLGVTVRGGGFATQNGLADAFVASPATGEIITHRADTLIEFTWTAATGETLELMFRRTDDDNCWIFRGSQGGSTAKLIRKVGGVETEVKTAAQTWTNGTAYRIVIGCDAQTIRRWINNAQMSASAIDGSVFMNGTTAKVSGFATGANFAAWPGYVNPNTGAGVKPDLLIFDGDSLTAGTGATVSNYPDRTMSKFRGYGPRLNFGVGGATWANMISDAAAQIDALYSASAHARNIVICWEFPNDPANALTDATTYINARVAAGWKVVVLTALPFGNGSTEATRTAFNAGIRALASSNVAVADVAADSRIGDAGDQNDTTYYNADKTHLIDAGYEIVAGIVAAALETV